MRESTKEFLRYVVNILAIVLLVLIVEGVIEFKKKNNTYPFEERIKAITKQFSNFIDTEKANLDISMAPPKLRRRPLTFIQREEALRQYRPDLFANFSDSEWTKFWDLIYVPIETKQGKRKVKRYRTRQEVEDILSERYSRVLAYFKDSQWQELWGIAKIFWSNIEQAEGGAR